MKKKNRLWAIHSWTGLYAGIAIAFLSLTGAMAVFRFEFDTLFNPHLRTVKPGDEKVQLSPVVEKIKQQHPDKYLFEIELPTTSKGSWNVRLFANDAGRLSPCFGRFSSTPTQEKYLESEIIIKHSATTSATSTYDSMKAFLAGRS